MLELFSKKWLSLPLSELVFFSPADWDWEAFRNWHNDPAAPLLRAHAGGLSRHYVLWVRLEKPTNTHTHTHTWMSRVQFVGAKRWREWTAKTSCRLINRKQSGAERIPLFSTHCARKPNWRPPKSDQTNHCFLSAFNLLLMNDWN